MLPIHYLFFSDDLKTKLYYYDLIVKNPVHNLKLLEDLDIAIKNDQFIWITYKIQESKEYFESLKITY